MHPILVVVLLLYVVFLVFYGVYSVFLIYHLLAFSVRREQGWTFVALFLFVSAILLGVSVLLLVRLPWNGRWVPPAGITPTSSIR